MSIILKNKKSTIEILPAKGALITRWQMLFGTKNIDILAPNLGIPILFPFPGRSYHDQNEGQWLYKNKVYPMPIHGIASYFPWQCLHQNDLKVELVLQSSADIQQHFPFLFSLKAALELKDNQLRLDFFIENLGDEPMPCAFGVHPYWFIPDFKNATVQIPATYQYQVDAQGLKTPNGTKINVDEFYKIESEVFGSQIFGELQDNSYSLDLRDYRICCEWGPEKKFSYLVAYSKIKENFFCLEPWTAQPSAHTLAPKELLYLKANTTQHFFCHFTILK